MPSVSSKQLSKSVRMCMLVKRIIKTNSSKLHLHAFLLEWWKTIFGNMDFIESNTYINSFFSQIFIENSQGIPPCYVLQRNTGSYKTWSLTLKRLLGKQDIQNQSYAKSTWEIQSTKWHRKLSKKESTVASRSERELLEDEWTWFRPRIIFRMWLFGRIE